MKNEQTHTVPSIKKIKKLTNKIHNNMQPFKYENNDLNVYWHRLYIEIIEFQKELYFF